VLKPGSDHEIADGPLHSAGLLAAENLAFNSKPGLEPRIISFILKAGDCIWIKGPSGEGKTTLLRTIARFIPPVQGVVRFEGVSWEEIPPARWRCRILYLHQKAVLFPGKVQDNLKRAFNFRIRDSERLDFEQARTELSSLLLPDDILDRDSLTLSVGEASRVALARALILNPAVLLLDEVTAALDSQSRDAVVSRLREWVESGNRGLVWVAHDDALLKLLPGKEISLDSLGWD
jgi:putative ABC transport system ATP-binding protein